MDIEFPDLPDDLVGDETLFYEIPIPDADPDQTTVVLEVLDIANPRRKELELVEGTQDSPVYRGFVDLPFVHTDSTQLNPNARVRVTVTQGSDTQFEETGLSPKPTRGFWVRTVEGRRTHVSIFGRNLVRFQTGSNLTAPSPMTGGLWTSEGRQLVGRSFGVEYSRFNITGEKVHGIVVAGGPGTEVVATIETVNFGGQKKGELIQYAGFDGRILNRAAANMGPFLANGDFIYFGRQLGGQKSLYRQSYKSQPQLIGTLPQSDKLFLLPNKKIAVWTRSNELAEFKTGHRVSPPLPTRSISVDQTGFWVLSRQGAVSSIDRYKWDPKGKQFCFHRTVEFRGRLATDNFGIGILSSSYSTGIALLAVNNSTEGNALQISPTSEKWLKFDKKIQSIKASPAGKNGYQTSVFWPRSTLGLSNSEIPLTIETQPGADVELRGNGGTVLESTADDIGNALFTVPASAEDRSFVVTDGGEDKGFGGRLGVRVADQPTWGAHGTREASVGLYDYTGKTAILHKQKPPNKNLKYSGTLSSKNTLFSLVNGQLSRLSFQTAKSSFAPENAVIDFAVHGEVAWYLKNTDQTGQKQKLVKWDGRCFEESCHTLKNCVAVSAISADLAVIFLRGGPSNAPMRAMLAGVDLVGCLNPIRDIIQIYAVTNGPKRIWVSAMNSSRQKVLLTLDRKARVEAPAFVPGFGFDPMIFAGNGGTAWSYAPTKGGTLSKALYLTDPNKQPLTLDMGGGGGIALFAGPNQCSFLTKGSQGRVRCREIRRNSATELEQLTDRGFQDDTFIYKLLEFPG